MLELNASDERGIDVVRNKIKSFAQRKVTLPPGRHKMIILDEADSMTAGAQQALRRTMEIYSNTTRFALACNMSNKIIEPIQSRCAILRYSKLRDAEVLKRLKEICEAEGVKYNDEGLAALIFTAEGDMRQAINNLQSTWSGFGFVSNDNVFKICDQPHPIILRNMILECSKGNVDTALETIHALWDKGYSAVDIVVSIFRVVKGMDDLPEYTKLEFIRVSHIATARTLDAELTAGNRMDAHACPGRRRNADPARGHDRQAVQDGHPAREVQALVRSPVYYTTHALPCTSYTVFSVTVLHALAASRGRALISPLQVGN